VLIHTIEHPDFGIASIMEEAIGGGILIYEQRQKKQYRITC
jgi:hypothetical protein